MCSDQPDVCIPTWSQTNDETGNRYGGNSNRYPGLASHTQMIRYVEYKNAKWDGSLYPSWLHRQL